MPPLSLLAAVCFALQAPLPSAGEGRPADAIFREFEAIVVPRFELGHGNDPSYSKTLKEGQDVAKEKRRLLSLEMLATHVDDPRLGGMLSDHWGWLIEHPDRARASLDQIRSAALRIKDAKSRSDILSQSCWMALITVSQEPDKGLREVDAFAFALAAPGDRRVARYLEYVAFLEKDHAKAAAIHRRIIAEYPKTLPAEHSVASLHRIEGIGRPFELRFNDVLTGREITTAGLKGKVVVVEFWAASQVSSVKLCSPMKTLYDKYKDQGAEFVSINVDPAQDEKGDARLRALLTKYEIPWPQYHLATGFDDDLARYWGPGSLGTATLPEVFLVDDEGNLVTTEALGKLNSLLPEALARAKARRKP